MKMASAKTWDEKKGVLKDRQVRMMLEAKITEYYNRLNQQEIKDWTVKEIKKFLISGSASVCFSDFADKYVERIRRNGKDSTSQNYDRAIKAMRLYYCREDILCSDMTVASLTNWFDSLISQKKIASAKSFYSYGKKMYAELMRQVNDPDAGIIKVHSNPFDRITLSLPKTKKVKRALSADVLRKFFGGDISQLSEAVRTQRDYLLLSLCLAGINYADLIEMKKESYHDKIIEWDRRKTRDKKEDGSHMELVVPKIAMDVLDRHRDPKGELLIDMARVYRDSLTACSSAQKHCKQICRVLGITDNVTQYTMRHSWATIAVNDLSQSVEDVAFAMTHASAHTMTMGYVRPDYSRATKVNNAVVAYIFGDDAV